MWLQFKITCLHYHKSFLKFSGVGIYQSTNLHSFLCFLKYKSNTTKIHFLSIQFDKFGQTVLLVKAGFGIFSICVSVSTKWLLLWKTEARPNTKYISTHPLQGEGTQGVPVRFLAVLKYLFCLLTAKLFSVLFSLSESSDYTIQSSKCSLFVNVYIKSQLVLGVLFNVLIKKFWQPL